MPLEEGILTLNSRQLPLTGYSSLLRLYEFRDHILQYFRDNPELLTKPYEFKRSISTDGWREVFTHTCKKNRILKALRSFGANENTIKAEEDFVDWNGKFVKFYKGANESAEFCGYALIDLSLILVHLLNIYVPNKKLLHNLYSTNTQVDALGEENTAIAIASIEKVVRRCLSSFDRLFFPGAHAEALIAIIRHDINSDKRLMGPDRGIEFERTCSRNLEAAGFLVQVTPQTGDFGADLIAEKDGVRYAIQCKSQAKPVGVKAVQEALAGRSHYRTDFAVVCSTGEFTEAAVELASSCKVLLCREDQLLTRLDVA